MFITYSFWKLFPSQFSIMSLIFALYWKKYFNSIKLNKIKYYGLNSPDLPTKHPHITK
jgi:hypothetical protein